MSLRCWSDLGVQDAPLVGRYRQPARGERRRRRESVASVSIRLVEAS